MVVSSWALACGGQISGGDGGASADSGKDASTVSDGGVVVGTGISCGGATCQPGTQTCCIEGPSRSCTGTTCSGKVLRLECDDTADCSGKLCCYTSILASAMGAAMCLDDCAGFSGTQLCKQAADCKNGGPCRTYTCGVAPATVPLGLCAATAPVGCQ